MWTESKYSLGSGQDLHEQHLLTKCHRFNVPYGRGQQLCWLDEVDKMEEMRDEALDFLNGKSTSVRDEAQQASLTKIETISRQLIASLFYFKQNSMIDDGENELLFEGLIKCRLSASCGASMRSLIQAKPMFRIYEGVGPSPSDLTLHTEAWNTSDYSTKRTF